MYALEKLQVRGVNLDKPRESRIFSIRILSQISEDGQSRAEPDNTKGKLSKKKKKKKSFKLISKSVINS